jgi:hypothetical protein
MEIVLTSWGEKMLALKWLVLLAAPIAAAADRNEYPPHGTVYAQFEVGRTDFNCRFTSARRDSVDCEFVQVSIWPHADVEEAARKAASEFDQDLAKNGAQAAMAALRSSCVELKPKVETASARQIDRVKGNPQGGWYLADFKKDEANLTRMCACSSPECLRALSIEAARQTAGTCKFWVNSYKATFARNGKAWVNVDTSTDCYSTISTTLASVKQSLWTVRVTKVPRPEGKDNKACTNEVVDMVSTWEDPGTFHPDCTGFRWNWLF